MRRGYVHRPRRIGMSRWEARDKALEECVRRWNQKQLLLLDDVTKPR